MKDNGLGIGFAIALSAAFVGVAALVYKLVEPFWGQPETSALLAGGIGCPLLVVTIGAAALAIHWRDERLAARREKESARRQHTVERQAQEASSYGMNAAMMRQVLGMVGDIAQIQARQATATLGGLKVAQLTAPQDEPSWFLGDWSYDDDETEDAQTAGGVRFL